METEKRTFTNIMEENLHRKEQLNNIEICASRLKEYHTEVFLRHQGSPVPKTRGCKRTFIVRFKCDICVDMHIAHIMHLLFTAYKA